MKYLYLALIILAVVILLAVLVCLCRKWACRKVLRLCTKQKCRKLNDALSPSGFCYNPCCDCFCSTQEAWQQKLGYCRFYDESAPLMNMVIDCEPIYFTCDDKNWLIECWKGQYGMTAGAEIGIYNAAQSTQRPEDILYYGVAEEEQPHVSFTLRKGDKVLLRREERHWWLTGFCLGEFVWPDELCMEVSVCFASHNMKNAFCEGLLRAGYSAEEIRVQCLCVSFCICRPKTKQPKRCRCLLRWVQRANRRRCRKYLCVTDCCTDTLDRVTYLAYCFPHLYRALIHMGRCRSLRKAHKKYARQCRRNR